MSKVEGRYAASSEQWADAIQAEERERIIALLKTIECVGCDKEDSCEFLDSRDYLILVIDEMQA